MNHDTSKSLRPRRWIAAFAFAVVLALLAAPALPQAPTPAKKALTVEDYAKWRTIAGQSISADGKWVAYVLQLTNTIPAEAKPVLHLLNLETHADVTVADAVEPVFSADSKWIAYQVDPGAAQRARAARNSSGAGGAAANQAPSSTAATPAPAAGAAPAAQQSQGTRGGAAAAIPPRRVELRNLATGAVRSWQDIGTFAFSPASSHLFLRRRGSDSAAPAGARGGGAPGGPGGTPGGADSGASSSSAGPRGLDVILLDLGTGRHQLLGSVADIAFNRTGELLAFTVDSAVKDGNGVFVFEARTGRVSALDNDAKSYSRLGWSDEGNSLAVLKGGDVEKMREKDNVLVAFPDVAAALKESIAAAPVVLEAAKADGFPKGWVISDRAALAWSEDGKRVFFGIKEQAASPDTTRRSTDEAADVDVWNTGDERVQSLQMARAEQDRNFTFRQAFDVAARRFVKLADETMRELDVAPDGKWAVGRDTRGYVHDSMLPAANIYRVNTSSGERTLIAKGQLIGAHVFGISPQGRHFLFWKNEKLQAYDFETGATRTLGAERAPSFVDIEYDHPGPKPSYGIAGFSSDGQAVVVQHRYDLWLLPLNGADPKNLTGGAGDKGEIRFSIVRTEPVDPVLPRSVGPRGSIDLTKPITLSASGEWTKKAGFYELTSAGLKELVYEDAAFGNPVRALKADVFLFTRQTFVEFPDLRVSGPGFRESKKISDANPQQAEYMWGHRLLFGYANKDGVRLQGILALPDDYKAGEKRPMIVTFYEKNSQNMHRYNAPSYLTGMGGSPMQAVTAGYVTMMPDVHFRTGSSHTDMLECVEAATRKVIEMGYADPKKIAVTGHSYGGEGAAFIGTMSKMFAAVGMGAGVIDLYYDFTQNWGWAYAVSGGSGENAFDYYIYNQGRWGFSPWDQPQRYLYESAITHVPNVTAPFLIMHGGADPTVDFHNGLGFYNALRYNHKTAVFLSYPGEGHGLRGLANRRDLTIRYFEFFDHYLKGAPAPKWLTDGVSYLKKDASRAPASDKAGYFE